MELNTAREILLALVLEDYKIAYEWKEQGAKPALREVDEESHSFIHRGRVCTVSAPYNIPGGMHKGYTITVSPITKGETVVLTSLASTDYTLDALSALERLN